MIDKMDNTQTKVEVETSQKEGVFKITFTSNVSKLTKVESGQQAAMQEDWIDLSIDPSGRIGEQPKIIVQSHTKMTKADSGRG